MTHSLGSPTRDLPVLTPTASIQRSNYEVVQDEADEFVMNEDEEPRELYRRLTTLAVSLRDHGSKDTDDNWIKRKFLKAMMPYHKAMSSVIRKGRTFTPCPQVKCWMSLLQ